MSGDTLHRLTEEGRRLVSDGFMRGETELADGADQYVEPVPSGVTGDLERLDEAVTSVVADHAHTDTAMDGALVVDVHESLDVSRRVAADPGLWHWLAVVRYPEFVRHRWEYTTEEAMREKFLGAGTDLYSNAIHRLWWIAELTHDGDDYTLTRGVFDNQTMVNKVFDRWFARYRPAVVALCDELADEPSWVIDDVTRRFNHALTTVQLEGLDEAAARETVTQIVADVHDES